MAPTPGSDLHHPGEGAVARRLPLEPQFPVSTPAVEPLFTAKGHHLGPPTLGWHEMRRNVGSCQFLLPQSYTGVEFHGLKPLQQALSPQFFVALGKLFPLCPPVPL